MQRHGPRHFTAYTITAFVYIVLAGFIFYSQTRKVSDAPIKIQSVIQMSLSTFVPEMLIAPEKVVEKVVEEIKEEVIEEIVEPIPTPLSKKSIEKPIVIPKPIFKPIKKVVPPKKKKIIKKKPKPKPKKKKVIKKKTKKMTKNKHMTKTKQKARSKTKSQHLAKKPSHASSAQRNKFFGHLRKKIERYKSYPRIAQKRGLEGVVTVRFIIKNNGHIGKITVSGSKIFYNSAREAVKKAFPILVKQCPIALPETITLSLKYQIR